MTLARHGSTNAYSRQVTLKPKDPMYSQANEFSNNPVKVADADYELPEIDESSQFTFACNPGVPCYNRCCADVAIPLTPYDVARICRNLGQSSEKFLSTFTERNTIPETGIILPMLKMIVSPDAPCPFVTPAGCSIYDDRPGACRSWPVGRGSSLGSDGVVTRYFLVRESYCEGFCSDKSYTPGQWLVHEGMDKYNNFNDRYMTLSSRIAACGKPLDGKMANMCFLALYQLDRFRELIANLKIFNRVSIEPQIQELIMHNSSSGDEACLAFAYNWLELIIFGHSEELQKKD